MQVISELSKEQLYSAAIDSQSLHSSLDSISKEYPDLRPDVPDALIKKVNSVTTTLGTFIQLVNDLDKTIERTPLAIQANPVDLPTEGPWLQRAREIKAIKQVDTDLDLKFSLAQSEIKDLILQLKLKEKSLEEAHVKIKLLDSRMGNVKKSADRISLLEKQMAEAKARETQFEEAIETLNGDLRVAEGEVGKWRKAAKEGKVGLPMQSERNDSLIGATALEDARLVEQVCSWDM
jgi:dynactin 1